MRIEQWKSAPIRNLQKSNPSEVANEKLGAKKMDEVSKSETGQCQPKPTREERDEAFSAGGGRKAVEEPMTNEADAKKKDSISAPVGLECETKGDRESNP